MLLPRRILVWQSAEALAPSSQIGRSVTSRPMTHLSTALEPRLLWCCYVGTPYSMPSAAGWIRHSICTTCSMLPSSSMCFGYSSMPSLQPC